MLMSARSSRRRTARRQLGLSLVEMMVGVAIGLFVVAAAAMLVATQLADNRRLLLETQVQQDLRATSDIIARELRRAGYWGTSRQGVWNGSAPVANPYRGVNLVSASEINLSYSSARTEAAENNVVDGSEQFGYRLNGSTFAVDSLLGAGGWQALSDAATLKVTAFTITLETVTTTPVACPAECPGGGEACWPTLSVREIQVAISGVAVSDPAVQRSVRNRVRLRNDLLTGACPA